MLNEILTSTELLALKSTNVRNCRIEDLTISEIKELTPIFNLHECHFTLEAILLRQEKMTDFPMRNL